MAESVREQPFDGWPDELMGSVYDAREAFEATQRDGAKPSQAEQVVAALEDAYEVFPAEDGHVYALSRIGAMPAERLSRGFVLRACRRLGREVSKTGAEDVATRLEAYAAESPVRATSLRVASVDGGRGLVIDLAHPGSARCVVVTADGWRGADQPPEGVAFRRTPATRPLPVPGRGGSFDELRALLVLPAGDERLLQIRGWMIASLLPHIPRPLLALCGPQGSAKTTRAWMTVSVLDPKPDGALGGALGRSVRDDQVKALSQFSVAYDNLGHITPAQSDFLARLVTGESDEHRRLYSDAELASIIYRRTGVFTALTLPGNLQPDALERIIPIELERIPESDRKAEAELLAAYREAHPRLLGALLDEVVELLAGHEGLVAPPSGLPRMADYFLALHARCPRLAEAYRQVSVDTLADAADADPFVQTLVDFLEENTGSWVGSATDLHHLVEEARYGQFSTGGDWWPKNGQALSRALTINSEKLRAAGIAVTNSRGAQGKRALHLTYAEPEPKTTFSDATSDATCTCGHCAT